MANRCLTDWRASWTPMQARRSTDLVSCWTTRTEAPISGVRTIVPWSWPSLFGNLDGTVFNTESENIFGEWATMVIANDWHLFKGGTPRIIFPDGDFSTYAVNMTIPAAAEAMADFIVDHPSLQWIDGVHIDYYVNPVGLGASSFDDYIGDTDFYEDFDLGIAAFAARMRSRKPSWLLIGQLDQRAARPEMEDPLNGYYLEQRIGLFAPQTSFGTVQGWITDHAADMAIAHPGREQLWIVEYRSYRTAWNPAPFGMTADEYFQAHVDLCENTGSYLSLGRDEEAEYFGHTPTPGKSVATVDLRPVGPGLNPQNQWQPDNGAPGTYTNWAAVNDENDATLVRTNASLKIDLHAFEPVPAEAEAILDVSLGFRLMGNGPTAVRIYYSLSGERVGMLHNSILGVPTTFVDPGIIVPGYLDWTIAFANGISGGYQSYIANDDDNALVSECFLRVRYEYTSLVEPPQPILTGDLVLNPSSATGTLSLPPTTITTDLVIEE